MGVKGALPRAHFGQERGLRVAQRAEQTCGKAAWGPGSPECTRRPPEGGRGRDPGPRRASFAANGVCSYSLIQNVNEKNNFL